MHAPSVLVLAGDGLGRDMMSLSRRVLKEGIVPVLPETAITFHHRLISEEAYKKYGWRVPPGTMKAIERAIQIWKGPTLTSEGEDPRPLKDDDIKTSINVWLRKVKKAFDSVRTSESSFESLKKLVREGPVHLRIVPVDVGLAHATERTHSDGQGASIVATYNKEPFKEGFRRAFEEAKEQNIPFVTLVDKANIFSQAHKLAREAREEVLDELRQHYDVRDGVVYLDKNDPSKTITFDINLIDLQSERLAANPYQKNAVFVTERYFAEYLEAIATGINAAIAENGGMTRRQIKLTTHREATEGIYTARQVRTGDSVILEGDFTSNVERFFERAFESVEKNGRKRLIVPDDRRYPKTFGFYKEVAERVAKNHPRVKLETPDYLEYIKETLRDPAQFADSEEALENLGGDKKTDLNAGLTGGLGNSGGAIYGDNGVAIFEQVAGPGMRIIKSGNRRFADPSAQMNTLAMLLNHRGHSRVAKALEWAVKQAHKEKKMAQGLSGLSRKEIKEGGFATAVEFTDQVIKLVKKRLREQKTAIRAEEKHALRVVARNK